MNSLFGDATTQAATPQQRAEVESLMSGSGRGESRGRGSERGGSRLTSEAAIPGLDIEPPDVENGRSPPKSENGDGVGGWISNIVKKSKGDDDSAGGKYKRVGQDED